MMNVSDDVVQNLKRAFLMMDTSKNSATASTTNNAASTTTTTNTTAAAPTHLPLNYQLIIIVDITRSMSPEISAVMRFIEDLSKVTQFVNCLDVKIVLYSDTDDKDGKCGLQCIKVPVSDQDFLNKCTTTIAGAKCAVGGNDHNDAACVALAVALLQDDDYDTYDGTLVYLITDYGVRYNKEEILMTSEELREYYDNVLNDRYLIQRDDRNTLNKHTNECRRELLAKTTADGTRSHHNINNKKVPSLKFKAPKYQDVDKFIKFGVWLTNPRAIQLLRKFVHNAVNPYALMNDIF